MKKPETFFVSQAPMVTPDVPISNSELEELKILAALRKLLQSQYSKAFCQKVLKTINSSAIISVKHFLMPF
jgi:hypothetical protein